MCVCVRAREKLSSSRGSISSCLLHEESTDRLLVTFFNFFALWRFGSHSQHAKQKQNRKKKTDG